MRESNFMNSLKAVNEIRRDDIMRGIVVDVNDPMLEGRVAIMVPKMLTKFDPADVSSVKLKESINLDNLKNDELKGYIAPTVETSNSIWFRPKFLFNFEVPNKGDVVDCFFEDGDVQKPYYFSSKCSLNGEVTPMENIQHTSDKYDVEAKPKVKVIFEYADGTIMYYNENDNHKMFSVKLSSGFEFNIKDNSEEEKIELLTKNKNKIVVDDALNKISINTTGGNKITLSDENESISIVSSKGASLVLNDSCVLKSSDGSVINLSSSVRVSSSQGGELEVSSTVKHTDGNKGHKL